MESASLPRTLDVEESVSTRPFHDETRRSIVERRLVTILRTVMLFALVTLTMPVLLLVGAVTDLGRWIVRRTPWMSLRLILFAWVYLGAELVGLAWLFGIWVASGFGAAEKRLVEWTWPVQTWWAATLFGSVRRLFSIDVAVEGDALVEPGPIIAMFRHASIVDNLLPAVLVSDRHDIRLRWIIKRELLSVPALDVAGTRLPNYFVDRASSDPRRELRNIRRLAADLGRHDGVLIYPEGTRFTLRRRARALEDLEERDPDLHARAEQLEYVLPPRIGGALALLDQGYDVLLCGHEGLDGFARISDVWSGALVGRTVRVRFWRKTAESIPQVRAERIEWLFDQWTAIDRWIASVKKGSLRG